MAAAIPARFLALGQADISGYLPVVIAIAVGAVVAAYLGAAWLKRLSPIALSRIISALLLILGLGLLADPMLARMPNGLLPANEVLRIVAGLFFQFVIGSISTVLGVAGGEVIIPTLIFGYGIAIKAAGSLSMMISFANGVDRTHAARCIGIFQKPQSVHHLSCLWALVRLLAR